MIETLFWNLFDLGDASRMMFYHPNVRSNHLISLDVISLERLTAGKSTRKKGIEESEEHEGKLMLIF